ncbi:hypothetical protein [Actinotalea subterranea]|uniref:hypothetical protein n=1 Tax=Actinotalea subterranea TaxID=2607497 RepID=UPI0011EBB77F|nr:hypothetical protein [Actinotalea subterranea]
MAAREPHDSPDPTEAAGSPAGATPGAEERVTWAGNRPLDSRWWWSPSLMVVVGIVVIGYQMSAYLGEGGIWLNGVMIAVGVVVVGAGVVSMVRARRRHLAAGTDLPPSGDA